ncbi:MAG: restriction endonuclease subunit S [Labilibaculum sp.]|nr:restriction endonuclease subunit S [Labilibaculum sp.]
MKSWKSYQLGELYNISSGLSKSKDAFGFGKTFISFKDVFHNWFLPQNPIGLVNSSEKDQFTCSVLKGDVLITRTSETANEIGMSSVALVDYPKSTFNGFCKRLRPKKETPLEISPDFIGYLFRSRDFRKKVAQYATMTTRASLNGDSIKRMSFVFPPFIEQKAIAKILTAFDDKIENLQAQNKTLETTAQTIFKEWFGKYQMGDELPEGWRVGTIGELTEIRRGGSPRPIKDYISDSGYRWLKISDATATNSPYIFNIKEHIKTEGLKKTTLKIKGDLVLSNSATPGMPKFLAVDTCIHDGWMHFPTSKVSNEYLYLLFLFIRPTLVRQGSGSVFVNLKTDILRYYETVIPSVLTLLSFDNVIKPIFEKIYNNSIQIQTLKKTRDTLLPKLMSGALRVDGFKE